MKVPNTIHVIGGGLAGSEAAWQLARRGVRVDLYEMRPVMQTQKDLRVYHGAQGSHATARPRNVTSPNRLKL